MSAKHAVNFIAAIDSKRGMAKEGKIPWNLPLDVRHYRHDIEHHLCLMGWGTFASYGFKPLPDSKTVVITEKETEPVDGVHFVRDFNEVFDTLDQDLWVIGGGNVFAQLLPRATRLYLTRVKSDFNCDVFFPEFATLFQLVEHDDPYCEGELEYTFEEWERREYVP